MFCRNYLNRKSVWSRADQLDPGSFLLGLFLLLASALPHRTFAHSLLALGMITWVTDILEPERAPVVFAGYLSHLVADSLTPHGVPWLWPSQRCFRIARIPTGSGMDHVIGVAALRHCSAPSSSGGSVKRKAPRNGVPVFFLTQTLETPARATPSLSGSRRWGFQSGPPAAL